MYTLIPMAIFFLLSFGGMAQDPLPLGDASPLQTAEALFTGDDEGTRRMDGESRPLAAQVVALGGKLVHENKTIRPVGKDTDKVSIHLNKKGNILLLKVVDVIGQWAACARIVPEEK